MKVVKLMMMFLEEIKMDHFTGSLCRLSPFPSPLSLCPLRPDSQQKNDETTFKINKIIRDEYSTGDQTKILGLPIFLGHISLSSIGQKILMILPPPF